MQTSAVPLRPFALLTFLLHIFLLIQPAHVSAEPDLAELGDPDSETCEGPALYLIQTKAHMNKAVSTVSPKGFVEASPSFFLQAWGGDTPEGQTSVAQSPMSQGPISQALLADSAEHAHTAFFQTGSEVLAPSEDCGVVSPSLLHMELEALRRGGYLAQQPPCDVATLAKAWIGQPRLLELGGVREHFGLRSGHRNLTAAMYIVLFWAAGYVMLVMRLSSGLFGKRAGQKQQKRRCEEAESWRESFFSWLTLSWATPWVSMLVARASEGHTSLTEEELGPLCDHDDSTDACYRRFIELWNAEIQQKGLEQASLKRVLVRYIGIKRILGIGCLIGIMQIITFVVAVATADMCLGYVDWMVKIRELDPHVKFQLAAPCAIMIFGYTIIPVITMLLTLLIQLLDRRVDLRNEAALGMAIYCKALKLPVWHKHQEDARKLHDAADASTANNIDAVQLICVDVKQNTASLAASLSSCCCLPFFAVVVIVMAWIHLGKALVLGFTCTMPISFFMLWLGRKLQYLLIEFQSIVDRRLTLLREVFQNIRVVKCYGWEDVCEDKIISIREEEMRFIINSATVMGCLMTVLILLPKLFSLGSLVSVLWVHGNLPPHLIFVALQSLKNFLTLFESVQAHIMKFLMAWPSLQRIESFLKLPEVPENPRTPPPHSAALRLHGSFAWSQEGRQVLHDIDLTIKPGSLVAIVGEVGAGKSALVHAILGEMHRCGVGHAVEGPARVAYCAQTPWITGGTIRENVLGGCSAVDEQRYRQAIAAACLQPDLEAWAGGDAASVGGRGLVLSGGQRMRVALARAAYDSSDLLLLDDPLAAVDTRTGEALLQQLVSGEIMKDRTRLVVVQPDVDRLTRFDEVVVLSQGRVIGQGTPAEIMDSMSLRRFLRPAPVTMGAAKVDKAAESTDDAGKSEREAQTLFADEGLEWANWESLFFLLNQGKCRFVVICAVLQMAFGAASFMSEIQLALWANSKHDPRRVIPDMHYIVASIVWAAISGLIATGNLTSAVMFAKNASRTIFRQALRSVLNAPMPSFHDKTPVGQVLARLSFDMGMVDRNVFGKLMSFFMEPFFLVFGVIFVHMAMPRIFSFMALPFYAIVLWLGSLYLKALPQLALTNRGMVSKIVMRLTEVEDMRVSARAHGLRQHFQDAYAACNDSQLKAQFLAQPTLGLWFRMRVCTVTSLLMTLIALTGIFAVQRLHAGTFALCVMSLGHVITALPGFIDGIAGLQFEFAGIRRLKEYCELPREGADIFECSGDSEKCLPEISLNMPALEATVDGVHATCRPDSPLLVPSKDGQALVPGNAELLISFGLSQLTQGRLIVGIGGVTGPASLLARELSGPAGQRTLRLRKPWLDGGARVQLESLTVAYRSSADVLRGVDLSFEAGQKVGIVGRTGCGKSTLLFSILRIVEPRSGRILLNGVDNTSVGLKALRQAVGLVPQEPVLFTGSVRTNLDPAGHLSDTEIWDALRKVRVASCVESLPGRLEYRICGDGGLSMGQRQLLCLARVVYRRPGLLLLDEATSSLDPCTEEDVIQSVFGGFQESTLIAVAHKLQTVLSFDHVVVMDSGTVLEQGPVKELQQQEGVFARMLAAAQDW